jgi:hypothetical protein
MTDEFADLTGVIECHIHCGVPFVGVAVNIDKSETYLSHLHVQLTFVTSHFSVQTLTEKLYVYYSVYSYCISLALSISHFLLYRCLSSCLWKSSPLEAVLESSLFLPSFPLVETL